MKASEEVTKVVVLTMTPEEAHGLCKFIGNTSTKSRQDTLNKHESFPNSESVANSLGNIHHILDDLGYGRAQ